MYCYFDNIVGSVNEYTGELLAIREFNEEHETKKICKIPGLLFGRPIKASWNGQMYILHDFQRPLYNRYISNVPGPGIVYLT